jgi:hypothetical protein
MRFASTQANDVEKGCQVPLVTRIYSIAQCFIIWLGEVEDEDEAAAAIRSVTEISELCIAIAGASRKLSYQLEVIGRIPWQALDALLENTWFRRICCY